ncbi:adenylosuccinate lyase [Desulfobotulus alkaliphilus]|uniref:Adenylosuccinate lyase n=1 Tax=Desulfobotulus alkaliphilus TaxID=622671 RepID=A0A562RHL4_9BACT|nr:adenylosuccinate lyase [Desulfobotulus alkaliphilus]TWI68609.1 adenylosuccinate lyase [Desulfobotulus alkaliphilus]
MEQICALSVLDGRYRRLTEDLRDIFSEYGLIRHRLIVELRWLRFLVEHLKVVEIAAEDLDRIDAIAKDFGPEEALKVKAIEKTTNHDVKAVEYYIKEKLDALGLEKVREWTHFACTSDDINNTAYALMLQKGRDFIMARVQEVLESLEALARSGRSAAMMSRTHGQPATPTTMGKEMVNFAWRLRQEMESLASISIGAKMNGATGNFNAHMAAFPEVDWIAASKIFLSDYLGVMPVMYSTQINPNHSIAQVLHTMVRMAGVLMDLDRDMWGYISLGYFRQRLKEGEVGSSTMPHKVNPIDFENGEGNLGLAVALMEHMAFKLLQSRFQRDLTDSTVLRNMGALFGYMSIGCRNTLKGLGKVALDEERLAADLAANPELLAEPIQTVMRVYGEDNPYEKLKELTRGRKTGLEDFTRLIDSLEKVPQQAKDGMRKLTPADYTGLAAALVDHYFAEYP